MRASGRARDSTLGLSNREPGTLPYGTLIPQRSRHFGAHPPPGDEKTPVGKINIGTILMKCARRLF